MEQAVDNRRETLFLYSIPYSMAASCFGGVAIGPLRHTGAIWIATVFFGILLIALKRGRQVTFPVLVWAPFYSFMGISLLWGGFDYRDNIQLYVQYLAFPVVGIVASYTIRNVEFVRKINIHFVIAIGIIGLFCVYYTVGPGRHYVDPKSSLYQGFADRPAATSLIVVASIFLAQYHRSKTISILVWLLCFGICLLSASRMATVVLLGLWLIHPRLASIQSRLFMSAAVVLIGLAAFNTPIIQDRFFTKKYGFKGKGTIEDVMEGKFDSAGRFETWPKVIEKSGDAPWFGHGVGESTPFILSIWSHMDKPHNEYLKMLYEGGATGLSLFLLGMIGTLGNLWWNLAKTGQTNWVTSAAIMGWVGFILMAIVDNPLVYGNNFLHPLFMLVGAANGITYQWLQDKNAAGVNVSEERGLSRGRYVPRPIPMR